MSKNLSKILSISNLPGSISAPFLRDVIISLCTDPVFDPITIIFCDVEPRMMTDSFRGFALYKDSEIAKNVYSILMQELHFKNNHNKVIQEFKEKCPYAYIEIVNDERWIPKDIYSRIKTLIDSKEKSNDEKQNGMIITTEVEKKFKLDFNEFMQVIGSDVVKNTEKLPLKDYSSKLKSCEKLVEQIKWEQTIYKTTYKVVNYLLELLDETIRTTEWETPEFTLVIDGDNLNWLKETVLKYFNRNMIEAWLKYGIMNLIRKHLQDTVYVIINDWNDTKENKIEFVVTIVTNEDEKQEHGTICHWVD
jgi:hypothetical protein